jgi:hypothetical protein
MGFKRKILLSTLLAGMLGCSAQAIFKESACESVNISKSLKTICKFESQSFIAEAQLSGMTILDNKLHVLIHTSSLSTSLIPVLEQNNINITHFSVLNNSIGALVDSPVQLIFLSNQKNILRIEPQTAQHTRNKGLNYEF